MKLQNIYDFDKTILKKDSTLLFYFYLLKNKPYLFWHFFVFSFMAILYCFKIISVEKLKECMLYPFKYFDNKNEILNTFAKKAQKYCNAYYIMQKRDDDVICSASPTFIVSAIMKNINDCAVVIGSDINFDTLKFSNGAKNCKGYHKIECLKEYFSQEEITCENSYSDSLSDIYMFDIAKNAYLIIGNKPALYKQNGSLNKLPYNLKLKLKYVFKMMRPKHYIKNLLIFFPLFISVNIFNFDKLLITFVGFLAFCLISSFVYTVNDLCDLKNDRKHTTKRLRAVASGIITKFEAVLCAVILFTISTIICFAYTNAISFIILIGYALANIAYSLKLKDIPILDLILLSAFYVIRVVYGCCLTNEPLLVIILLVVFSMATFIGIIKRKNELLYQTEITRKVNTIYSAKLLSIFETIFLILTVAFYGLYIFSLVKDVAFGFNSLLLSYSAVIVLFILIKYFVLTNQQGNSGNPMEVVFKSFSLLLLIALFLVVTTLGFYIQFPYYSFCLLLFIAITTLSLIIFAIPKKIYVKLFNIFKALLLSDNRFSEVLRFLIVGGTATLIDFLVTGTVEYLLEKSNFERFIDVFINSSILSTSSVIIGNTVGFFTGLIINYVFSIIFVYKENGNSKTIKGFVLFTILSVIGLAINLLGIYLMFDTLHINQWLSKIVMTIIVIVYNYISRKYLIFNKKYTN